MSTDNQETTYPERSPLDVAEHIFQLVASTLSSPSINGEMFGNEFSHRQIPLTELPDLLAYLNLSDSIHDIVWRELVTRARSDSPQWFEGAVGVAIPTLRQISADVCHGYLAEEQRDIEAEILAAFIRAVRTADIDQPNLFPRMCDTGRRAGLRSREKFGFNSGPRISDDTSILRPFPLTAPADGMPIGDAEPTQPPMTDCPDAKEFGATEISARSRITSDPPPNTTKPKGGWGSPTGSARFHPPTRRYRRIFHSLWMAAIIILILAFTTAVVLAETSGSPPTAQAAVPKDLNTVFDNLRNWLIGLLAALATLMFTIGGFRYLLAGGDPGEIQKAKAAFRASAYGYGLAVLAPLFVSVLKRVVGG